ncbi:MAG: hypothetical protein AAF335_02410 [Bacteroidota bacterium]
MNKIRIVASLSLTVLMMPSLHAAALNTIPKTYIELWVFKKDNSNRMAMNSYFQDRTYPTDYCNLFEPERYVKMMVDFNNTAKTITEKWGIGIDNNFVNFQQGYANLIIKVSSRENGSSFYIVPNDRINDLSNSPDGSLEHILVNEPTVPGIKLYSKNEAIEEMYNNKYQKDKDFFLDENGNNVINNIITLKQEAEKQEERKEKRKKAEEMEETIFATVIIVVLAWYVYKLMSKSKKTKKK